MKGPPAPPSPSHCSVMRTAPPTTRYKRSQRDLLRRRQQQGIKSLFSASWRTTRAIYSVWRPKAYKSSTHFFLTRKRPRRRTSSRSRHSMKRRNLYKIFTPRCIRRARFFRIKWPWTLLWRSRSVKDASMSLISDRVSAASGARPSDPSNGFHYSSLPSFPSSACPTGVWETICTYRASTVFSAILNSIRTLTWWNSPLQWRQACTWQPTSFWACSSSWDCSLRRLARVQLRDQLSCLSSSLLALLTWL